MVSKNHIGQRLTVKEVVQTILDTDRVMPAHLTKDKDRGRAKSFLIDYEPLVADTEYQMAAVIWNDIPKLLTEIEKIDKDLYHSLVRLFEDYSLAGFILTNEKMEFHKGSILKDLNQFHIHKLNGGKELKDAIERSDVRLALEESYQTGWIAAQKTRFPQAKSLKELKKLSRHRKPVYVRETAKSLGAFAFYLAIGVTMTIYAIWLAGPGGKKPSTRMVRVNSQYDGVAVTLEDRTSVSVEKIRNFPGEDVRLVACGVSKEKLKTAGTIIDCSGGGKTYFIEFTE